MPGPLGSSAAPARPTPTAPAHSATLAAGLRLHRQLVASCASKPPKQQENICSIFEQKSSWYRIVNKSEEKWGAPIYVQMAIMRQESAFQNRIKPERTKLLGIIPWKRKSSSLGYTQAVDATWDCIKKKIIN